MRIEILQNFATKEEINILNSWAEEGVSNGWLDFGIDNQNFTNKRLTSRLYGHRYEYPDIVRSLSQRIRKAVGIDSFPLITGHGKNGVVVSYTYPGGDVYRHRDPCGSTGLATLRCNILTQKADKGCQLYIEEDEININVGDLHCYLVSEHDHWTTSVEGETPRIMWMFGAHVNKDDWNNYTIEINKDWQCQTT